MTTRGGCSRNTNPTESICEPERCGECAEVRSVRHSEFAACLACRLRTTSRPSLLRRTLAFDVGVMGEVIEHIPNHPLGLMREVARVLRPHGLLALTTPNPLE